MSRAQIRLLLAGAVVTIALLFSPMRFATDREFWERLMDAAHVPFFAAFTLFLTAVLPGHRLAVAALVVALVASAVEVIQPLTGRGESLVDLVNGLIGVALAVGGWQAWRGGWRLRLLFLIAGCALTLTALQPAWRELRGMLWRRAHYPLLADFESEDEMRLWSASDHDPRLRQVTTITRSPEHASHGAHSLRIDTAIAPWPGVRFRMGDADWRPYRTLAFDIYNPGEPFTVALRVDDDASQQHHDERYNGALPLTTGWNHLRIPLAEIERGPKTRPLRMNAIRRVLFFRDAPREPHTLHLDHVRLE